MCHRFRWSGGLLLCWGLLGFEGTRPYAWIALIIDYGTVATVLAIPVLILDAWSTSSANVVHRFVSGSNGRSDDFRLFKRGKFTIKSQHNPPSPDNEHGALIVSRGFVGTWSTAPEGYLLEGYGEDRVLRIVVDGGKVTTIEENYPVDAPFPVDRLGALQLKRLK
jgi:hypothetical protein